MMWELKAILIFVLGSYCYGGGHRKVEETIYQQALPNELCEKIIYHLIAQANEKKIKHPLFLRECCKEFKKIIDSAPGIFRPRLYIQRKNSEENNLKKVAAEVKNYNYHYIIIIKDVLLSPEEEALCKKIFPNAEYQIQLSDLPKSSPDKILSYSPSINFIKILIEDHGDLVNELLIPKLECHRKNFLLKALDTPHLRELNLPSNKLWELETFRHFLGLEIIISGWKRARLC